MNTTEIQNQPPRPVGFWARYRLWIILISIVLFLPPLAFFFQITQDVNFCGSWCPRMFFSYRAGTSAGQFLSGFIRSVMGVALVGGVLATTFFWGRHWCSHLCPVGGSLEVIGNLVPQSLKLDYKFIPAPSFRNGYLFVYLLAPAIGIGSLCCNYCNFAAVPRLFGAAFSQADMAYFLRTAGLINLGLLLLLGIMAKGGRAYCNLLCPIGAMDAISSRIGSRFGRRVRVNADKCMGCGMCKGVCPTWAIEAATDESLKAEINQMSCMPCRSCQSACPAEAITYGKK